MSRRSPAARLRRKLKNQEAARLNAIRLQELRTEGASCSRCRYYGSSSIGRCCDLDTDFYGVCLVKPDHLCIQFEPRDKRP